MGTRERKRGAEEERSEEEDEQPCSDSEVLDLLSRAALWFLYSSSKEAFTFHGPWPMQLPAQTRS